MLRTWAVHWLSAVLAVFLLATSLPPAFSLMDRPFPSNWMSIHLSIGIALMVITIGRVVKQIWNVKNRRSSRAYWGDMPWLKYCLLLVVLAVTTTGVPIYQTSPLGNGSSVFGIIAMPVIIRLGHGLHNYIINIHIMLTALLLALVIAHGLNGFRRKRPETRTYLSLMAWPWRSRIKSRTSSL